MEWPCLRPGAWRGYSVRQGPRGRPARSGSLGRRPGQTEGSVPIREERLLQGAAVRERRAAVRGCRGRAQPSVTPQTRRREVPGPRRADARPVPAGMAPRPQVDPALGRAPSALRGRRRPVHAPMAIGAGALGPDTQVQGWQGRWGALTSPAPRARANSAPRAPRPRAPPVSPGRHHPRLTP